MVQTSGDISERSAQLVEESDIDLQNTKNCIKGKIIPNERIASKQQITVASALLQRNLVEG